MIFLNKKSFFSAMVFGGFSTLFFCINAVAQDSAKLPTNERMIPNEFETVGGHALGMANAGMVAQGGISSVKLNPAMMPLEKTYAVSGGYNWPSEGREFFQAGVVDSKSSEFSAGFIYNGFSGNYLNQEQDEKIADSPVNRRFCVGIAQALDKISLGFNLQYLEANVETPNEDDPEEMDAEVEKGTGFGIGLAGLLSDNLRFGASVENLANKRIAKYAPRTYRAGIAYLFGRSQITLHFDLRQRDRIDEYEKIDLSDETLALTDEQTNDISDENNLYDDPERLAIGSMSVKVYDVVRILGGYGQSITGADRKILAGGIALVSNNVSLSYTAERPYMKSIAAQQAINFALSLKL